ncbi:MAG: aspartate aminotransferase family protein, partial [Chitinophagaceae bacterium]
MNNTRNLFFQHVAQTSPEPLGLEIMRAKGNLLIDRSGKKYLDLIAGISVCNVGHRHPAVVKAIQRQLKHYLHVLVYGEIIESPQVQYAHQLTRHLPESLDMVYFTNSGAEAIEGAMKLAKRVTQKTQFISFAKSYHGSTQGALSIMGDETWKNPFRPLLPDVVQGEFNDLSVLKQITGRTAAVVLELVQAERGVYAAEAGWLQALQQRCRDTGTLIIVDEIQTGFGRTGTLWAFEQTPLVPDILVLGKALGGGMPLGAFVAHQKLMLQLSVSPALGHITTFGGHPVCCAAGLAAFHILAKEKLLSTVQQKADLFRQLLQHPSIRAVRAKGLLIAVEFDSADDAQAIIQYCIRNGVLTDWFL